MLLSLIPVHAHANSKPQSVNYVSLGDSLAAGMLHNWTFGKGYPTFIHHYLTEEGYDVNSFKRGVAGFTTSDVLWQLDVDLHLRNKLKSANIVTIDAGANDLLNAVGNVHNIDLENMTPEEILELKAIAAEETANIKRNMEFILDIIEYLNPDASVYVMGYYNAFPYLEDNMQPLVTELISNLNTALESGTENQKATFVPTFKVFEVQYKEYLPNETNIHPNEAGYEAMAQAFLAYILPDLAKGPSEPNDSENLINDVYTLSVSKEQLQLNSGQTEQLKVEVINPNGESLGITEKATYESSDPNIVEVNKHGLISTKKIGSATIEVAMNI